MGKAMVGATIRQKRLELGLSQQELGAGRYSKTYLSRVERGQVQPSEKFLQHVAAILGFSLFELLSEMPISNKGAQRISRQIQDTELTKAAQFLEEGKAADAKAVLERLKTEWVAAELPITYYIILGEAEITLQENEAGRQHLQTALALLEKTAPTETAPSETARLWIGIAYSQQNQPSQAIIQHSRCLQAIEQGLLTDPAFELRLYSSLAKEFLQVGDIPAAIKLYTRAIEVAKANQATQKLADLYWGRALAHYENGGLSDARTGFEKSAALYRQNENWNNALKALNRLAWVAIEQGDFGEADVILNGLTQSSLAQEAYVTLAFLYRTRKRWNEAEQAVKTAMRLAQETANSLGLGLGWAQAAELNLAVGEQERALADFERAVKNLEATPYNYYLEKWYFRYATVLEQSGRVRQAIEKFRKAVYYQSLEPKFQYDML